MFQKLLFAIAVAAVGIFSHSPCSAQDVVVFRIPLAEFGATATGSPNILFEIFEPSSFSTTAGGSPNILMAVDVETGAYVALIMDGPVVRGGVMETPTGGFGIINSESDFVNVLQHPVFGPVILGGVLETPTGGLG